MAFIWEAVMSLESYVTGLMKNPSPSGLDRLALCGLEKLEKVYLSGVEKKRNAALAKQVSVEVPVISVGNVTAGGTGKTPCILLLAEALQKRGRKPAVISRGYRSGLEKEGGVVSDGKNILVSQAMAGDEPYMMARKLPGVPILVGKDRITSAQKAMNMGADVLLMDDGFQYWQLKRDLDIILIDCTNPFGYDHALPRGLLREPLSALQRAGLFILTKSDQVHAVDVMDIKEKLHELAPGVDILTSCHAPSKVVLYDKWKQSIHEGPLQEAAMKKALLLSGIGNPGAFAETAKEAGLRMVGQMAFDDHHHYTEEDVRNAISEAKAKGAEWIVMTEKDAVKMLNLTSLAKSDIPFAVLEIEMTVHGDEEKLFRLIQKKIGIRD